MDRLKKVKVRGKVTESESDGQAERKLKSAAKLKKLKVMDRLKES